MHNQFRSQGNGKWWVTTFKQTNYGSYGSKLIEKMSYLCPGQCPNFSAQLQHTILRGAV